MNLQTKKLFILFIVFVSQLFLFANAYAQEAAKDEKPPSKEGSKFGANFTIGFSTGVHSDSFGLSKMFNRLAAAVKNFQASSLDDGSKGKVKGSYLFDLNFFGQYNIHRAEFLFIRVGYTYSPLIPGNYNIRTKVLLDDETRALGGLNRAFSFSRRVYGYQMEVPILLGIEAEFKKVASAYIAAGPSVIIARLTIEDNGITATSIGDNSGNILTSTDIKFSNRYVYDGLGLTFLIGGRYKVWDHISIFLEIRFLVARVNARVIRSPNRQEVTHLQAAYDSFRIARINESDGELISKATDIAIEETLRTFYKSGEVAGSLVGSVNYVLNPNDTSPYQNITLSKYWNWSFGVSYEF